MKNVIKRAIELHNNGQFLSARRLILKNYGARLSHPDGFHFMSKNELGMGNFDRAIDWGLKAIRLAPLRVEYHQTLSEAYRREGDYRRAEWHCRLGLRLDEDSADTLNTLGLVFKDQDKLQEAIRFFSLAIEKKRPHLEAMNNLAATLFRVGDNELAEKYLRLVLQINPEDPLALNNLGLVLRSDRRLGDAKKAFLAAGDYLPARFNLGHVYLLEDNLRNGLVLYELRKRFLNIGRGLKKREWNGEPDPRKTLLVISEQGFGDAIMMGRFYPALDRFFRKVYIQTSGPLMRLMKCIPCEAEFVSEEAVVDYDLWCSSMSLPYLLNMDAIQKIPQEPWFEIDATPQESDRLRIGLNWAGNPSYHFDAVRSAHLKDLEMFFRVEDVEWYSLHKGHLEQEAQAYELPEPLKNAEDFYDTAVFIKTLDMVISTETAIPNLSAALGVPTCVLSSPDFDWRWNSWYDKAYLCPQDQQGNWHGAVAKALQLICTLFENRLLIKRSA